MSAPVVVQVTPSDQETDVVLGQSIVVTFDQAIDTSTLNDSTFSLTYPAPTQVLTTGQLISGEAAPSTVVIEGTWAFTTDTQGRTVATFTPSKAFPQNSLVTATILGSDASLSTQDLMNLARQAMAVSYQWSFTTGVLNLLVPPPASPLAVVAPAIQLEQIKIIPRQRRLIGLDLAQEFDIVFPGTIDPTSFDPADIYMSIEPLLGDPNVSVPSGLSYSAVVQDNKIKVTVTGWPAS